MTHICVVKLTIIGSDNGLSPGRRQAIICTNAGILLIGPLGTNFIEILIGIQTFSFKKMHLKMSSAKWRPFGLGLNVLSHCGPVTPYGFIGLVACSTPSPYLKKNDELLPIEQTLSNKLQWNFNPNKPMSSHENAFENVVWKIAAILFSLDVLWR